MERNEPPTAGPDFATGTPPEHPDRQHRHEHGLADRRRSRPATLSQADVAADRDPVAVLQLQSVDRVPELVPIRYGRMVGSPFAFYRGAAAVMAADLAQTAHSGIVVQLCGDAHLSNFGVFGSPERRLVFDLNDFDETHRGPFEWDVKRLVASVEVLARQLGLTGKHRRRICRHTAAAYRTAVREFAEGTMLNLWYAHLDMERLLDELKPTMPAKASRRAGAEMAKARARDSMQAVSKLTTTTGGGRRIVSSPPLVVPLGELLPVEAADSITQQLRMLFHGYQASLPAERRGLVAQYRLVDVARKVVGVGSVGTRSWILLLQGADDADTIMLQAKEAVASVLEPYAGRSRYPNHGERVVEGQRLIQATSDIFLGWQRVQEPDGHSRDYYLRQLQDWKRSVRLDRLSSEQLTQYTRLCAWTLARAHARTGDRIRLAGYLGDDDEFDRAMALFAADYADRNEGDHELLRAAVTSGDLQAVEGV